MIVYLSNNERTYHTLGQKHSTLYQWPQVSEGRRDRDGLWSQSKKVKIFRCHEHINIREINSNIREINSNYIIPEYVLYGRSVARSTDLRLLSKLLDGFPLQDSPRHLGQLCTGPDQRP